MIHLVFHVSMLKKFVGYQNSIVPFEGVSIEENLTYEMVPIEILHQQIKRLRNKEVASIKVLMRKQQVKSSTWEAKADMMKLYHNVFHSS